MLRKDGDSDAQRDAVLHCRHPDIGNSLPNLPRNLLGSRAVGGRQQKEEFLTTVTTREVRSPQGLSERRSDGGKNLVSLAWPKRSLMCLKWSRSHMSAASGVIVRDD